MFNLDDVTNENNKEHIGRWLYIANHWHRILIIAGSGSGKINVYFNLIKEQNDIGKMCSYAKYLS